MHETFPGRVLSCFDDQNWLLRSCDLTPLNFFFKELFEVKGLYPQTSIPSSIEGGDSKLHHQNSATFMQNGLEKNDISVLMYQQRVEVICRMFFLKYEECINITLPMGLRREKSNYNQITIFYT